MISTSNKNAFLKFYEKIYLNKKSNSQMRILIFKRLLFSVYPHICSTYTLSNLIS